MKTPEHAPPAGPAANPWKIGRRGAACAACARPFEDGNLVFSTLAVAEAGDAAVFRRDDRCGLCHGQRPRGDGEILWRTRFEAAPRKAKLDLVALSEVFRQLAASADPRVRDLRFLVTLLLLRHRKLRVARTRTDGSGDFLVVSFGRQRQTFDVEVSDLSAERLEALRAQLVAIFEGGDALASAGEPPTAAAGGTPEVVASAPDAGAGPAAEAGIASAAR